MIAVRTLPIARDGQSKCPACRHYLPTFKHDVEVVCTHCDNVWTFA